jgi:hypothetical protein
MTGIMEPGRRSPWFRRKHKGCRRGQHQIVGRWWRIEGSPWKTLLRYCKHCPYVEDAYAKRDS